MKEFVEKLIDRLEELTHDNPMVTSNYILRKDAIEIVNQLAEEYNNGWIPCEKELPEKNQRCLIQYNGLLSGCKDYIDVDTYNGERFEFFGIKGVVAWMPLPAPYQKGSE